MRAASSQFVFEIAETFSRRMTLDAVRRLETPQEEEKTDEALISLAEAAVNLAAAA